MPSSRTTLVLDTNIWLEKYLPRRPEHDNVLALLGEARAREIALAFASQSALDVYQRVRKENKLWARKQGILDESLVRAIKRLAWDCVNDMQTLATAVPADASDLYLACKHRDTHYDLEDDMIVAACQRANARYLVTLDRKLLAHSPVEAHTPQEMVKLLRAGVAEQPPPREIQNALLLDWLKTV